MTNFMDIVNQAKQNELSEFDKLRDQEREAAELLRKQHHPGSISARELVAGEDPEQKILDELEQVELAAKKAQKEAKDVEDQQAGSDFPPPPIAKPG